MLEIALATAGVCLPAADFTDAQIDGIVRHCPRGPSRRPAGNGDVSKSTTGTRGVSAVSVREGAAAGSAASEWRVSSTEAPHVATVPPGNHLTGLTPGALEVESLACHLTKFGDVVAATRPSGAGLLLPAASKSAETSKTKAFKVAASVGGPAPPGGADGAPPSDSGGPRSAEPGAATAMTSASTATRIMAKRMAGWL